MKVADLPLDSNRLGIYGCQIVGGFIARTKLNPGQPCYRTDFWAKIHEIYNWNCDHWHCAVYNRVQHFTVF